MGEYHIIGGKKLYGETDVYGSKNSVLPIIAATILHDGFCLIKNCPKLADTFISIEILEAIGCSVIFENTNLIINSKGANKCDIPENLVRAMRSSIVFLGGLISKFKKATLSYPGGCELGLRPIDLHLKGLEKLGVEIKEEHGFITCTCEKLVGNIINLDFPSVGATENLMIAGILAKGETKIINAAKEPEIIDLQNFLISMGANIKGAGTDTIIINGVNKLHDTEYEVISDRIVAGTFLMAGAISKGKIILNNIDSETLLPITSQLIEMGCEIKFYEKKIYLKAPEKIKSIKKITTHPYPGFPKYYKGK